MSSVPLARRRRSLAMALATACVATTGVLSVPVAARADYAYTTNCPRAEALVSKATWHRHTLARGVLLSEGQAADSRGTVDMHILTVDMTQTTVHFAPLMRHIAQRTNLSALASGHSHLVAATNTGYFDFYTGAPLGPVAVSGHPLTMTSAKKPVVGFGTDHRVHSGNLWLAGTITVGGVTKPLNGINVLSIPYGFTMITPKWGAPSIRVPYNAMVRYVSSGKIATGTGTWTKPPTTGTMLIARGSTAVTWLRSLSKGASFSYHLGMKTDSTVAMPQAYNVGETIVATPGVVRTGLPCRKAYPQPARTAVGYANSGKKLILAIVTDHPGTRVHGLDATQMSSLMVQLGSTKAFLFDGSGSTELIARMPSTHLLYIRNYTADGQQRPMPVGLGVFTS